MDEIGKDRGRGPKISYAEVTCSILPPSIEILGMIFLFRTLLVFEPRYLGPHMAW